MNVKDKIKESALDLLIEHGVHGTSTKMIIEKADISNGSLFHHFATKDDILIALYTDIKVEMFDAIYYSVLGMTSVRTFIYTYFKSSINWYLENPNKKTFLGMYSQMPAVRNCTNFIEKEKSDYVKNFILKAQQDGEIDFYNYNAFLYNFRHIVDGAFFYLKVNPTTDKDEFIDFTFSRYWRSIVNF